MNRREFVAVAAGAPFLLRSGGALAGLASEVPIALVTADTESHVAAVDLRTFEIVRRIDTHPGPRSIESVGGRIAVVAHTASGAVTLIDGRTLKVRHVLRGFVQPRYTAAGLDGRHAFVSDSARGEVATVDLRLGRVVARVPVGGPARHITASPNGRTLWVSLGTKAQEIAVVDVSRPVRPRFVRRFEPPFLAHDVGFVPSGRNVWVTSGDRGAIAIYTAAGLLIRRIAADSPPQHVTFLDGAAQVTSGDDGTLRVHRLRDARMLRETRIPVGSYNVQRAGGRVLTPSLDRGTLCVLDGRGALLRRVQVAASSHDACFVLRS
jgi:DNA-binding beta-propeller fold protein YncE